jgi:hypothetical protein
MIPGIDYYKLVPLVLEVNIVVLKESELDVILYNLATVKEKGRGSESSRSWKSV